MRKLILAVLFAVTAISGAYAQEGTKGIGVTASVGSKISSLGVGAKIQYNPTDHVRFGLSTDYYFKTDYKSLWSIDLDANYLFHMSPKLNLYPIVGLAYNNWKFDYDKLAGDLDDFDLDKVDGNAKTKHVNRIGANIGLGGEYFIMSNLALNLDIKYQIVKDFSRVVFSIGATYRFN